MRLSSVFWLLTASVWYVVYIYGVGAGSLLGFRSQAL